MLGVLMLQTRFPRPPGDIGHAQTFDFEVRRRVVAGATPERVVRCKAGTADPALLQPFIQTALQLVDEGCTAISTSCGFLALWQRELQAALPVPVWTSSLLQVPPPPLQANAGWPPVGVITIEAASLTAAHFLAVGADPATPVQGIQPGSPLHQTLMRDLPTLDEADARAQVLNAARQLCQRHPSIRTLVLECTNLPPYAPAVRTALGVTVLDVVTLLNQRMAALGRQAGGP